MPLRHCIACLNTRGFGILILQKRYQKKKNIYCLSLHSLFKPRESTQYFFETKEEATRIGLKYNFSDVTFSLLFPSTDAH